MEICVIKREPSSCIVMTHVTCVDSLYARTYNSDEVFVIVTLHIPIGRQKYIVDPRCNHVKVLVASCEELLRLVAYVDFS
eukprot:3607-Heterococcus_DN1.PRE.1